MTFVIRSKKIDLIQLALDLDESPDPSISKIVLRDLIISSKYYKEEEAKELLEVITAERNANQSATQNNGQTSSVKSLDEIVKMVRLLTVKVPNKSDGWDYLFSSLEKAFASEMVSDELKPKVLLRMLGDKVSNFLVNLGEEELKDYESLKQVVLEDRRRVAPTRCLGGAQSEENPLAQSSQDLRVDSGNVDETEVSLGILPEKAQEHIEDFQTNITSCRNEVGTLGTKDEEVTAEMDKRIMVDDSFRSEQEC
ncbi:retrovirus-related Pol polyprotein from transposon opus [Trichonephila clavipes]|nr:retrovirus-related Pol polyprotein from transposon opus [Trichonephila clavipes]